jgi:hypothetical protein
VNRVRRRLGLRAPLSEIDRLALARWRIYADATRRYKVRDYRGSAVLVRPMANLVAREQVLIDGSFGWGGHVDELEIWDVPGDHIKHLRRPNVNVLLDRLRPKITAARNHQSDRSVKSP